MIIDAHQHYWRIDRGDYGWLTPAAGPLYRDYLPDELGPLLQAVGVAKTVLVQAAATEAETRYLATLAQANATVAGVVGWVDMESDDIAPRLRSLREACGTALKGVRPMIQDIPDDQWVTSRRLDAAFDALQSQSMTFDALVHTRHLRPLLARLDRHPDLAVVIDHCAKPDIATVDFMVWSEHLRALATNPHVHCKLSGLMSQLGPEQHVDALRPYVDFVLDAFGPERVIWGSDWPVLGLRSSYERWFEITLKLLGDMDGAELDAILGDNANRFYNLGIQSCGS